MSEGKSAVGQLRPVKVIFHKANDIPMHHADGVWGLVSPDNEAIVLKFFLEYGPTPQAVTFPLKADGTVSPEPDQTMESVDPKYYTMIREFQTGVVMSMNGVRQLHHLLAHFIDAHNKQSAVDSQQSK